MIRDINVVFHSVGQFDVYFAGKIVTLINQINYSPYVQANTSLLGVCKRVQNKATWCNPIDMFLIEFVSHFTF